MIKPLTAGGCKKKVAATDAPPPIRAATDAGPGPDEAEGAAGREVEGDVVDRAEPPLVGGELRA